MISPRGLQFGVIGGHGAVTVAGTRVPLDLGKSQGTGGLGGQSSVCATGDHAGGRAAVEEAVGCVSAPAVG